VYHRSVMRSALLLSILLVLGACGQGGDDDFDVIGEIHIYGDSLTIVVPESQPNGCLWCEPLIRERHQIWNWAHPGARSYSDALVFSVCEDPSYAFCAFSGVGQTTYQMGECRRTELYYGSSCIFDQAVIEGRVSVDVFFFGANDVAGVSVTEWENNIRNLSESAYDVMLETSEDAGHACVVVLGPPAFYHNQVDDPGDTNVKLVQLHDYLRDDVPRRWPNCALADVYEAFRNVEMEYGSDAMYEMYRDRLCVTNPPVGCLHPGFGPTEIAGVSPNELIGEVILDAIWEAYELTR
jgi:hypothetical protein